MKKNFPRKKLDLNKQTIVNLNSVEMRKIQGGSLPDTLDDENESKVVPSCPPCVPLGGGGPDGGIDNGPSRKESMPTTPNHKSIIGLRLRRKVLSFTLTSTWILEYNL